MAFCIYGAHTLADYTFHYGNIGKEVEPFIYPILCSQIAAVVRLL